MAHEPNDLEISTVHNSVSNLSSLKLLDEVAYEPNDSVNFKSSETGDIISNNYEEYRCETVYTLNNTPTQQFKIKKSKKHIVPLDNEKVGYTIEIMSTKNDKKLSLLVDTGASVSILPFQYLDCFQHKKTDKNVSLYAYNKEKVDVEGVYKVNIFIPNFGVVKQQFVVVKNNSMPIMGLDFLKKLQASLIFDTNCNQHVLEVPRSFIKKKVVLTVIESDSIPPNYTGIKTCVVSSSIPLKNGQNIVVPPSGPVMPCICTVNVVDNGYAIDVPVANGGVESLTIKNLIGQLECIEGNNLGKYETYKVDHDTFHTLSPFIPNMSVIDTPTTNILNDETKTVLCEYIHAVRNTKENDPLLTISHDIGHYLIRKSDTESINNITECPPAMPPPEKVREQWVKETISKLKLPNDVEEILLKNINSLSSGDMDAGQSRQTMDFEINPNFHKNKRLYKLDSTKLEFLRDQLSTLEYNDFIERIHVNWGIPVFVVQTGKKRRLVFDMRQSNNDIIDESRTFLPETFDIIQEVAQNTRFFSSLDLKKCYWGIRLSERVINSKFPVILTQLGSFLVKRCLTGMSNAPCWLENYLSKALETNAQGEYSPLESKINPFYDDISLASRDVLSRQDHLHDLDICLQRIEKTGLRISLEKSVFAVDLFNESVSLLGYTISYKSITPNSDKIKAIYDMPLPTTLVRLQAFLGSLVYYRKCLNLKASGAMAKLHDFTGKDKFNFDNLEYRKAFDMIKKNLCELTIYKPSLGSLNLLWTDSSNYAVGGVLMNVEAASLPRKKHKIVPFQGYITTNLKTRLESSRDWTRNLVVTTSSNNIFKSVHELIIQLNQDISYENFIEQILVKVYKNSKLYVPSLPLTEKEAKNLFNEIFHEVENKRDCIQSQNKLYVRHMMLLELSKILNRQFIFLTENNYFFAGNKQEKSPIIIFQDTDLYFTLISNQPYLNFSSTLHRTIDEIQPSEIAGFIENVIKNKEKYSIRPMGFYTKKLSQTEKLRPIYINEAYAIYSCLNYFKNESHLCRTIVLSDNLPSVQLINNRKFNSHVFPLLLKLNTEFPHIQYAYVKGSINASDIFSRPQNSLDIDKMSHFKFPVFSSENVELYQNYDAILEKSQESHTVNSLRTCFDIRKGYFEKYLNVNSWKETSRLHPPNDIDKYDVLDDIYYEKATSKKYLPEPLESVKIAELHFLKGHSGAKKLFDIINYHFSTENKSRLKLKIKDYVSNCISCLLSTPGKLPFVKGEIFKYSKMMNESYVSADIFEFNSQDNLSNRTLKTNKCLLFYEYFSQRVQIYLLKDGTDDAIVQCFVSYFSNSKIPKRVLIDNAPNLRSVKLLKIFKLLGVDVVNSAPYNSRSRGNIESKIKSVRNILRILKIEMPNLSPQLLLTLALPILNERPHLNRFAAPSDISQNCLYDTLPFLENHRQRDENCRLTRKRFNHMITKVREKELRKKAHALKIDNAKRLNSTYFNIGEFVVLKSYTHTDKQNPLYVNQVYSIEKIFSNSLMLKRITDNFTTIRHFSQIKKLSKPKYTCDLPSEIKENLNLIDWSNDIPKLDTSLVFDKDLDKKGVTTRSQAKHEQKLLNDEQ